MTVAAAITPEEQALAGPLRVARSPERDRLPVSVGSVARDVSVAPVA